MAINQVGLPFSGKIYGCEETSYKNGMNANTEWLSDSVLTVRLESGDINKTSRDISSRAVKSFSTSLIDPKLHVEYKWQGKSTSSDLTLQKMNLVTSGVLESYAFEIGASVDSAVSDSWFVCKGCVLTDTQIKSATGEEYIISLDFDVGEVSTPSDAATGTEPASAIGNGYAMFNAAGSITWTGMTHAYYVTKGITINISNNVAPYWDVGSRSKKCAYPTALDVKGSCDISMDGGGGMHWKEVCAGTDLATLVLSAAVGTNLEDKITLSNGRFDSARINQVTNGAGMFDDVPFTFKTIAFSSAST